MAAITAITAVRTFGMNFSRRKLTQPFPPSPASTFDNCLIDKLHRLSPSLAMHCMRPVNEKSPVVRRGLFAQPFSTADQAGSMLTNLRLFGPLVSNRTTPSAWQTGCDPYRNRR